MSGGQRGAIGVTINKANHPPNAHARTLMGVIRSVRTLPGLAWESEFLFCITASVALAPAGPVSCWLRAIKLSWCARPRWPISQ